MKKVRVYIINIRIIRIIQKSVIYIIIKKLQRYFNN